MVDITDTRIYHIISTVKDHHKEWETTRYNHCLGFNKNWLSRW
jgi:hypothetical protein